MIPLCASCAFRSSTSNRSSTSAWIDWPKIVALRMKSISRTIRNARVTSGAVISTRRVPGGFQGFQRFRCAVGNQLRVVDVGDVTAALGLVHVVRGDEKGDALPREVENQIP